MAVRRIVCLWLLIGIMGCGSGVVSGCSPLYEDDFESGDPISTHYDTPYTGSAAATANGIGVGGGWAAHWGGVGTASHVDFALKTDQFVQFTPNADGSVDFCYSADYNPDATYTDSDGYAVFEFEQHHPNPLSTVFYPLVSVTWDNLSLGGGAVASTDLVLFDSNFVEFDRADGVVSRTGSFVNIRVQGRTSSFTAGFGNSDGEARVYVDDVLVLTGSGMDIYSNTAGDPNLGGAADRYGFSTEPSGVIDNIKLGTPSTAVAALPSGTVGPYVWTEWPRIVPGVGTTTNFYSDLDMADPGTYYGGFKEARAISFGDAERALSNMRDGSWTGSTFTMQLSDFDRTIRERLASNTNRFWTQPLTVRMVDRATRAALGTPYTAFVGSIIDAKPTRQLAWDITLGDHVSQTILSDQGQLPYRMIGDNGLIQELVPTGQTVEGFDLTTPEPIIYGEHRRVVGVDPASPQGFCFRPIYVGVTDVGGNPYHVWFVCGHAVADIPDLRVDDVSDIAAEGTDWLVPHNAGWAGQFTNPYRDIIDAFGVSRRCSLVYGLVGSTNPDGCATGEKVLTLEIKGVEPVGDGSGSMISDRFCQYSHFLVNFVANRGADSYMCGEWKDNPTWSLFDIDVPIVDEASCDACSDIGIMRLPPDGYIGAAIIGAKSGERKSVRQWIAEWNRSCGTRFGVTHFGQMRIVMLSPTEAIKAAAMLVTDVNEILEGSFDVAVNWGEHANRIPFRADMNHATGEFMTLDAALDDASIANYGREIVGEIRDYLFAPGITASYHLAHMEVLINRHPPRTLTLEGTIDPFTNSTSLAYLDLGDYFTYRHFAGVTNTSTEIRLAQVIKHTVMVGARRVRIDAIDCEDLMGFDVPEAAAAETSIVDPSIMTSSDISGGDAGITGAETFADI